MPLSQSATLSSRSATQKALLDASPDCALLVDSRGFVIEHNREAARCLGEAGHSLTGQDCAGLFPPKLREMRRGWIDKALASGQPQQMQDGIDGLSYQLLLYPLPPSLLDADEPCVAIFIREITAARRTEDRLRAAIEDAATANQAKTEFMAKMSHEFRTPLNTITGFCETIAMEIFGRIEPPPYRDYVRGIFESSKQLVKVIDQIIDVKIFEDALRRGERSYRALFELSPDLICLCTDGEIKMINSAGAGLLRAGTGEELVGQKLTAFAHPDFAETLRRVLDGSGEAVRRLPVKMQSLTNQTVELEISAASVHGDEMFGVMIVGRDVTAHRKAQENAIAREQRYQAIMDTVADGIVTIDESGIIQDCNSAVSRIFGYDPADLTGRNVSVLMPSPMADLHDSFIKRYLTTGQGAIITRGREVIGRRKDGSEFPINLAVSEVHIGGRRMFTGTLRDLTENKQLSERVRYLANYDALTGLPNRSLVADRIAQAIAFAKRAGRGVGVLALDLDKFTMVNDSLGHAAADDLLRQVASRLNGCVRPTDTVARTGPDDFVLVAANLNASDDVGVIVERINSALQKPFLLSGEEVCMSCAIGASLFPSDGDEPDELLRNSATALHAIKGLDVGGFAFFNQAMTVSVVQRMTMERDLRHAIQNNEFQLYYQPQMDMTSNKLVGAEALIRWQHPRLGLVSPLQFIPLAEQNGLILPIGEWVLRTACVQMREWQDAGLPPIRVGVNLSGRQFRDDRLIPTVRQVLEETNLDPACLDLELTESLLMTDVEETVKTIDGLKALGVEISVDDFGTGYSSLAYLKRFSIDTLKIDRAFVKDLDTDPDDEAIAVAIISLAHSLKMNTIAEGVENEAQAEILRQHDCDEIQGYLISRPIPADQFRSLIAEFEKRAQRTPAE